MRDSGTTPARPRATLTLDGPAPSPGADGASLVARLREDGVRTVIVAGCDTHGIMRGKRVPIDELPSVLADGLRLCEAIWALLVDEREPVARPPGHPGWFPGDGYPDVVAVPDPATVRGVPWHDATAIVLCDFARADGAPLPVSPRGVLRAVVERARRMGFEPLAGVELELYLLRETPASVAAKRPSQLVPVAAEPRAYGVAAASREEPLLAGLRDRLTEMGLGVEACHLEAGPGQMEVTLRHGPALDAADRAFLLKTAVKELAERAGLLATFMAKPRADWPGSSCHLHLGLRDADGGDAFADPRDADGMSGAMRSFVAGAAAGMAELSALVAPTPNSYRRFTPHSWAPTVAGWSFDNRSAAVRVVHDGAGAPRVEHRRAGGDANAYLALAAALASGLDGIARGLEPPAPLHGDLYAAPPPDAVPLPRTLAEAADRLADSRLAREWLGDDLVAHHLALVRAELDAQAAAVTDWETARYLEAL